MLNNISTKFNLSLILIVLIFINQFAIAKERYEGIDEKQIYLTNLNHINITQEDANSIKGIKQLIKNKKPKAIYLEQWITIEKGNKNILKKLNKIASKNKTKLYLVIGKNSWFGERGIVNALTAYEAYGKYIDGIVLRVEPNKINVWKDDPNIKAQILNLMLDAYSAIYGEAKKRNKSFIAEFPFWFSEFQGPLKTFSQDVCDVSDKVVFLIDNPDMVDKLEIRWNDVTCPYNINITKRATSQSEEKLQEVLTKLNTKLTFFSNFNGYIVDSDSNLKENLEVTITID